jgi:hypothetical protein
MSKGIVTVQTWGTYPDGGLGLVNFLRSEYRGENPGHASLELRLPVTAENTELIEQYCTKSPQIPCKKKMYLKEDGTEEVEYVVRFSFVAGTTQGSKAEFHLNASYQEDTIYERTGHNTSRRHLLEVTELQQRRGKKRVISIFPACTLTEKGRSLDFATPEGQYILKKKEIENCVDLLDTIDLLSKKCKKFKENKKRIDFYHAGNKTVLIAAHQLGIKLPKGEVAVELLDSILNIGALKKDVTAKLEQLTKEENELKNKMNQKFQGYRNIIPELNRILEIIKASNPEPNILQVLSLRIRQLKISEEQKRQLLALIQANELDGLKKVISDLHTQYENENAQILKERNFFFMNEEDYLCRGRPADAQVQLPLGNKENELNAEAMLKQMRQILDAGYHYDYHTHNCSSTALSILKAGISGRVSKVSPAKGFTTSIPQTVHNVAIALRAKVCPISPRRSLADLDALYKEKTLGVNILSRECFSAHEAVLNFAVDTFFPEDEDIKNKTFYVFSKSDREHLLKNKDRLIPTELLRDLWGIIPLRTLPLSKDGSNNVVIDRNMTIGQLVQGLSISAINKSEYRLQMQNALVKPKEKDPYEILKNKIESEIFRISKRTDPKSVQKTAVLTHAYMNAVEKLNSLDRKSEEKAALLFDVLKPKLKMHTGFKIHAARSYSEVKRAAEKLGVIKLDAQKHFKTPLAQERNKQQEQNKEATPKDKSASKFSGA